MKPRSRLLVLTAVTAFALGACTLEAGAEPSPSVASDVDGDRPVPSGRLTDRVPETPAPQVGEVPGDLMARILDAASERAEVDVSQLEVIRAEAVTWPDGSLGCPEPGQAYIQVLIDGYHVVIEAGGEELDYRATEDGTFRYCENPGPNRPGDG